MRVKVKEVRKGIHPNEVVVSVETAEGRERLVVDRRSISSGGLEVGYPILERGDQYLVELPRETMRGLWRIWVARSDFMADSEERQLA